MTKIKNKNNPYGVETTTNSMTKNARRKPKSKDGGISSYFRSLSEKRRKEKEEAEKKANYDVYKEYRKRFPNSPIFNTEGMIGYVPQKRYSGNYKDKADKEFYGRYAYNPNDDPETEKRKNRNRIEIRRSKQDKEASEKASRDYMQKETVKSVKNMYPNVTSKQAEKIASDLVTSGVPMKESIKKYAPDLVQRTTRRFRC